MAIVVLLFTEAQGSLGLAAEAGPELARLGIETVRLFAMTTSWAPLSKDGRSTRLMP